MVVEMEGGDGILLLILSQLVSFQTDGAKLQSWTWF